MQVNITPTVYLSLREAARSPAIEIGGKAANLASLLEEGFPVPEGFVVTTAAFHRFVQLHGFAPGTEPAVVRSAHLPAEVSAGLEMVLRELGVPVAVRSSGVSEDLAGASYAGQYETVLEVKYGEAENALRRCWASAFEPHVVRYHETRGNQGIPPMAVLIQRMVPAESAGVAFTANPITGDREVIVNAVRGLADRLVSGEVDADQWSISDGRAERVHGATEALDAEQALRVAELALRVEEHFGSPQDVEWAMTDGEIHILQARPITTALPHATPVPVEVPAGNWEREGSHVPRPLTPFTGSIFYDLANDGLRSAIAEFGLLIETIEYRDIGGWTYMRTVPLGGKDRPPPPNWLIPILIRLVRPMRLRVRQSVKAVRSDMSGRLIDRWLREWQPELASRIAASRSVDLAGLSDEELEDELTSTLQLLEEGARRHFTLHLAIALPLADLAFTSRELIGWGEARIWDLLAGLSLMSTEPARRLADLTWRVETQPVLRAILARGGPQTLEMLAAADPDFALDLTNYLEQFAGRALGYEVAEPTLAESKGLTLSLLTHQVADGFDPAAQAAESAERRRLALAEARSALATQSPAGRERWEKARAQAERAYPIREDNVFYTISAPVAFVRYATLEIGNRLAQRLQLDAPDDIFLLTREEAVDALNDRRSRVDLVTKRRQERAWVETHPGPSSYGDGSSPPPALDSLPGEARLANQALLWYVEQVFGGRSQPGKEVRGMAASPGRYRGPVRIVTSDRDFHKLTPGDVLVCPTTSPAWSVLFPSIGGLVTDSGGILSHPAIIAREYRIPAVVSTGRATELLRDGQIVTVDGTTGVVEARKLD
jgi:pyruvate,water dikinase